MGKIINLTGEIFGRLKVIEFKGLDKHNKALWLCKCECENNIIVSSSDLKSGHTKSCGCLHKDILKNRMTKHNLNNTRLHRIWSAMKTRCYNKNFLYYNNYGNKGIKLCEEWKNDFMTFYNWAMSNGYQENLTIDRIDNDKEYSPENCRWITRKEQNNNKTTNILITYKNETHNLKQWSTILNINYETLKSRINRGWNIEKALTTPIKQRRKMNNG